MPPSASAALEMTHNSEEDSGLAALGRDYEKKKQKLLLELQLDYKDYVAKQKDHKSRVSDGQHQGLSLPIEDKGSVKERLRQERQREYNLFLQEQSQNRRGRKGTPPISAKPEPQASEAVNITSPGSPLSFLDVETRTPPQQKESPEFRRNVATLTEAGDIRRSPDIWKNGPRRRRRRWRIQPPEAKHCSEEELNMDEEDDFDFRPRARRDRSAFEEEYEEEWGTPEPRGRRTLQNIKKMEALTIQDQNSSGEIWKADVSQTPQSMKTAAKSTPASNKEKDFATGLMIGAAEERSVTQRKKEEYKQELLRQIAEQQQNKIKEKKAALKLGVNEGPAQGKEPEYKQQFGAASQDQESLRREVFDTSGFDPKRDNPFESSQHRTLGQISPAQFSPVFNQLPLAGIGTVQLAPPFDYCSGFPGMQAQVAFPWVPVVPPLPHVVSNADPSHYEAAYYQGGTRKQDPYSIQKQNRMLGGALQNETYQNPPPRPPSAREVNGSPLDSDGLHNDSSRQRSQSTEHYREALMQQVAEKETCLRREKEEKRRGGAQLEAEMEVYDPWGKGGGGAPIKDKHGNLVSNLYHMRRINNNRMNSLRAETGTPVSQQELSLQSPAQHGGYKEELKQQMEEKKKREAEERERLRIAEEKEAKRLEMERARIQQQYEDEQRREKEIRMRGRAKSHQSPSHIKSPSSSQQNKHKQSNEAKIQSISEGISKRQKNQTEPQITYRYERRPSPPIPTLQRKDTNAVTSRPSSGVSPPKSRTERILSTPNTQTVPQSKPSVPGGQQEVMRELSALRNFLRREQRELERQLGQTKNRHSQMRRVMEKYMHSGDKREARYGGLLFSLRAPAAAGLRS